MLPSSSFRLRQAHELFDRVLERPPNERLEFLANACPEDSELLAEVSSLLANYERVGENFMRLPAPPDPVGWIVDDSAKAEPDSLIGEQVGRYRVIAVIAKGGMGTVYEAVQEQPKRVVALKVLNQGVTHASALRRFWYEAQILSWLRHPNIAQVFEAGTHTLDSGTTVFYFAMEHIADARSITEYAADEALTTRERLSLFVKVCDAVHYGHQKGVIHRDLKPANILVTDECVTPSSRRSMSSSGRSCEPKIIDFGIARAIDSELAPTTRHTTIGRLVGTMQYMSPEQCDGDAAKIDTRSDIYSLGVVLYELLTGVSPYDTSGTALYAAVGVIKNEPPRRPSDVVRALRGDLDAILLKSLEKDPNLRYPSAADLAQDICRHLKREPIEARPPSVWARFTRCVYRHPAAITLSGSVTIGALVIAASIFGGWYAGLRPAYAVVTEDAREARVLSLNGKVVHRWRDPVGGPIQFCTLLEGMGDNRARLVLLGINGVPFGGLPLGLHAFDVDRDFDRPSWSLRVRPEDLPAHYRDPRSTAEQFGAWRAIEADVFDDADLSGIELLVVHKHVATTHSVIQVVDPGCRVHWQIWMDVLVDSIFWMNDAQLIVVFGANGEKLRYERDLPSTRGLNHPRVVFAVHPTRGVVRSEYLVQEEADRASVDPALQPAWYWCLPRFLDDYRVSEQRLCSPEPRSSAGRHVLMHVTVSSPDEATSAFGVDWILDENGRGGDDPHFTHGYQMARDGQLDGFDSSRVPPPEEWRLTQLPPVLPEHRSPPTTRPGR